MGLHCLGTDAELVSDLLIGGPYGYQRKYLNLSRGKDRALRARGVHSTSAFR